MDSDGDNSSPAHEPNAIPDRATIAAALKSIVQKRFKQDPELVTVGAARTHVEEELGLEPEFLKKDGYWNKEAKAIVKDEFNTLNEAVEEGEKPKKKKKPTPRKPATKKAAAKSAPKKAAAKESKPTDEGAGVEEEGVPKKTPVKRSRPSAKKAKPADDEDEGAAIGADESPKKTPAKRGRPAAATTKKPTLKSSRAKSTVGDSGVPAEPPVPAPAPAPAAVVAPDSESELSNVPDEPQKNPTRKRSQQNTDPVTKEPAPKKAQTKVTAKDEEGEDGPAPAPPPVTVGELSEVPDRPPTAKIGKRSFVTKPDSPKKKMKVSPKKAKSAPKEEVTEGVAEEVTEEPGDGFRDILQDRPTAPDADAGSDSEMSVVLDPTPQKARSSNTKKKIPAPKKTKSPKAPATRKGKAKKLDTKPDTNLDPEQEQLKSLKAWLLKCGIRRIWARELAKFDTPHAQIAYLRGLLTEIGMTGRYSAEKAKKIKEERELRAEVEAVQEGAGVWGMEEKVEVGRRRRSAGRRGRAVVEDEDEVEEAVEKPERVIRGREDLAFLDGQSESE